VVLLNSDPVQSYEVRPGDRIAQLVFLPVPEVALGWSEELDAGDRGSGGFGHTGR
jgi:dUTP pyrophosphatase